MEHPSLTEKALADGRSPGDLLIPPTDPVAFPRLNEAQLTEASAFGQLCTFKSGEILFAAGEYPFNGFLIRSGEVRIVDISAGKRTLFTRYGAGYFTGDIDLFTKRPSVVSCEAETDVEAVRLSPDQLRDMFVRRATLGELFWRSFQRRRELLLGSSFKGLGVYGSRDDPSTRDIVEMLSRNGVPHHWVDTAANAVELLPGLHGDSQSYPIVTLGNSVISEQPTRAELAEWVGLRRKLPDKSYDVLILGSGPSGLGAAVYAASEGMSCLVLDAAGPGGQAGSSSRIENYAGFPNGINGRELAHRTYLQSLKFGAEFIAPATITDLWRRSDGCYGVRTEEGDEAKGRTVIIASGVSYRLLDVAGADALRGAGIYYNATQMEAMLCQRSPVHVIGAGNSAGQAAMFLSQFCTQVSLVVRGSDLKRGMSSYLSERLLANDRIKLRFGTEVIGIDGVEHLQSVTLRDGHGMTTNEASAGVFVFIGAKPRTEFLPAEIARDDWGYVLTGAAVAALPSWPRDRVPCALETTWPGVFAAGDCRHGSTKRVAFAIGDGALAVTCLHQYFAQ